MYFNFKSIKMECFVESVCACPTGRTVRTGSGNQRTGVNDNPKYARIIVFIFIAAVLVFIAASLVYVYGTASTCRFSILGRTMANRDLCQLNSTDIWSVNFPKLLTESAIRLLDVNRDGVEDVLIGFATGGDGYQVPDIVCEIYFNGTHPCFGGVLALNAVTGKEIWRKYTKHEVFALNCNADLNFDGVRDCLAGGRAGVFLALDGRTGETLWTLETPSNDLSNFYTPQILHDLNQDQIPEILVSHGGDPLRAPGKPVKIPGLLFILDGKTGKILRTVEVPDKCESYYSPQIYEKLEGSFIVLFGTGGETHGGSLWAVELYDLLSKNASEIRFKQILFDNDKGIMVPPALVDVTGDGIVDIVMALFNSTVIALDGSDFHEIWRYSTANSESYSTPAVGYFNDDNVPDFFINYSVGPGYPIYYYSEATVLDGRNGKALLTTPIRDAIAVQSSPLTLSMEGTSDYFCFWMSGCKGQHNLTEQFRFIKNTKINQQSRSDICQLRFETDGYSRLYALNQYSSLPGILIHDTEHEIKYTEGTVMVLWYGYLYKGLLNADTIELANAYLNDHPEWRLDAGSLKKKIGKRHVGAHDNKGVQRLISTGTLSGSMFQKAAIDFIFATYWFYPAKTVTILEKDQKCIDEKMEKEQERFLKSSSYFGMDHDAYENTVEEECLTSRNRGKLEKGETFRDLFKLKMGSMTVHRKRLWCQSSSSNGISPMKQQRWAAYMGNTGSSLFFNSRKTAL